DRLGRWGGGGRWRRRTVIAAASEERSRQRNEGESSLEREHVVVLVSDATKLRETRHRVLIRSLVHFCTFLTTPRNSPVFSRRANTDRSPRSTRVHLHARRCHTPLQPPGHRPHTHHFLASLVHRDGAS